jgi:hypothetical protein
MRLTLRMAEGYTGAYIAHLSFGRLREPRDALSFTLGLDALE